MNNDILTEMRNRFSFLRSYLETIESLPSDKDKLAVFMAIARYGLDNEIPDFSGMESACYLNAIWRSLVRNIDSSIAKQQSPGPPIGSNNNPNGRRGKGREQESSSEQAERKEQAQSDMAPKKEEGLLGADGSASAQKEQIPLPYSSQNFVDTWDELRKQPKWKKKTKSALQKCLNQLAKYPEAFAIELMDTAIANDYQGVVFPSTPSAFETWKKGLSSSSQGASAQPSMCERRPDYLDA